MLEQQIERDLAREDKKYANVLAKEKAYIDQTVRAYNEAEAAKEKAMEQSVKKQMSWLDKLANSVKKAVSGDKASLNIGTGLKGYETGTNYVPYSGSYLVGERGPEIVDLPRGAAVRNNREVSGTLKTDMTETNNLLKQVIYAIGHMDHTVADLPRQQLRFSREGGY